jgi:hypothetical protein
VGRLLALLANIRTKWKDLPWINSIYYFAFSSLAKIKSLIILTPGVNVKKTFFSFLVSSDKLAK